MEEQVPTSAGLSSFNLLDEKKFFSALAPEQGMIVLDLGCGVGNYAIALAPHVGNAGHVYALDLWEEGIETLEVRASIGRHANITARVCTRRKNCRLKPEASTSA
ncbi:MAG TPA: methyltransferase domain-containing protein [Desulfobacteraceae bacterium]|nr:methyltransferase domain-containing protein [Desulfobacteraceae bacterium]